MDSLDPKPDQDRVEQIIQFPNKMEVMGKIERPHLGVSMWAVDMKTGVAEMVQIKATSLPVKSVNKVAMVAQLDMVKVEDHHQVVFDPSKWYVWASNKKNAERKYRNAVRDAKRKRNA